MKVTIEITCDNAAFTEDTPFEVARILRELADEWDDAINFHQGGLFDINGNRVGECKVS